MFSSVKLKVLVEQHLIFLHPAPHSSIPSEDPILRGVVALSLSSSKAVDMIRVKLEGKERYTGGDGWKHEESQVLKKNLEIQLGGEVLPAGEHRYEFSFIIPSSTSCFQRSVYGSTTHFVSAVMKGAGSFSSSTYFSSPVSIIHLVCNPAAPGELPDPLNTLLAAYHEGLGPINVNISAPHLTVSSLVLFHFSLLSPPASLSENLLSISAFVEQTFSITYKDGTMARPPVQKFNLFRVDQSTRSPKSTSPSGLDTPSPALTTLQPLGETKEGEEWNYRHLVRLLDDDKIRSTTPDATATAIRVSHKIGVTIKFRRQDGVEETVQLSKKVHIASCCCLRDSLRLPAYSRRETVTVVPESWLHCICDQSLEDLVKAEEKEALGIEEEEEGCSRWTPGPVDRLAKTPTVGFGGSERSTGVEQ